MHALNEIRRILVPNGILIDLRPIQGYRIVEVVSGDEVQEIGHIQDFPVCLAEYAASNQAIQESKSRSWFVKEAGDEFFLFYYWDTPSEMKEYIDTEWEHSRKLEDHVYQTAQSIWAVSDADARLRAKMNMLIHRWRKVS